MKATITKPDGTKVELEGLTDDVVKAVQALSPVPMFVPTPWRILPYQPWPQYDFTWATTTDTPEPA